MVSRILFIATSIFKFINISGDIVAKRPRKFGSKRETKWRSQKIEIQHMQETVHKKITIIMNIHSQKSAPDYDRSHL